MSGSDASVARNAVDGCRRVRFHRHFARAATLLACASLVFAGEAPGPTFELVEGTGVRGHNIFAPEVLRTDKGWRCYYGGWQEKGQLNDQIYVVEAEEPWGAWSPPRLQIAHGEYELLNDPSVARGDDGTWYMAYTVAFVNQNPLSFDEWIAVSTSQDGLHWSPDAGTAATKVRIADPSDLAGGKITGIARPSLVRDGDAWRLWFDADVAKKRAPQSFLAVATGKEPDGFILAHRYPALSDGFASFWEPDVQLISPGRYVAVCQRHFRELLLGESTDGVHFALGPVLSTSDAAYPRARVSNPCLIHDPARKTLLGLAFGMSGPSLIDHDIGFARYRGLRD